MLFAEGTAVQRSSGSSIAAERARWLSDLVEAIDEAQQLAWRISADGTNREVLDLYVRLELARCEVEALRRSGWAGQIGELPSEWTEFLPASLRLPLVAPEE